MVFVVKPFRASFSKKKKRDTQIVGTKCRSCAYSIPLLDGGRLCLFTYILSFLPRYGVTSVVTRTASEFATIHNSKARRRLPNDMAWSGVAPGFSCRDNQTDMEKDVLEERKSLGRFSTVVGNENDTHGRLTHACLGFFSDRITGKLAKLGGHFTFHPNDIIL